MLLALICLCKWRGGSCNRWASGGVEWVLPCCLRLLCNCIAKAKIENSVDLCMTVHFPPPFSYFPAVGLRVLNPAVKETTQECSAKLTICSKHWLVHEILACAWGKLWGTSVVYWFFFRTAGTERTCPGTRVPAFGSRNSRGECTPKKWSWFSALFSCRTRACHLALSQHSRSWTDWDMYV